MGGVGGGRKGGGGGEDGEEGEGEEGEQRGRVEEEGIWRVAIRGICFGLKRGRGCVEGGIGGGLKRRVELGGGSFIVGRSRVVDLSLLRLAVWLCELMREICC